jgi:glycosidase
MSRKIVGKVVCDNLDWFRKGVLYQIFPDRMARSNQHSETGLVQWEAMPSRENFFGGNFQGISEKVGYLDSMSVANIYMTPIFRAPANHRYDTEDYLDLDPLLGSEDDFTKLVTTADQKGIGIILDGVFNHCGETFEPFVKATKGDSRFRSWFHFESDGDEYQTCGGAQFMPKINTGNQEVVRYFEKVMRKWDAFGIRGWRLDVPWKNERSFWKSLKNLTSGLNSSSLWIAEAWAQWQFASEFNSIMNYHARNRLLDLVHLHHADAEDFFDDLGQWCATRTDPSLILNVVGSHDTTRLMNMCHGSTRDAQMILVLNALIPGVPMLYYGDEIGMAGENDPDCRRTFPVLLNENNEKFLNIVKPVFNLRGTHKSLSHGDLQLETARNHAFIFSRNFSNCRVLVAGNTSDRVERFSFDTSSDWQVVSGRIEVQIGEVFLHPRTLVYKLLPGCEC